MSHGSNPPGLLLQLNIVEGLQIAMPLLATSAFLARMFVRVRMIRRISIDDWFMGAAVLFMLAYGSAGLVLTLKQKELYWYRGADVLPKLLVIQKVRRFES